MEEKVLKQEGVLRHKVVKRKATRISYRVVGMVFVFLGGLIIASGMIKDKPGFILIAFGLAALIYGLTLVKGSFRRGAFTADYIFGDEHIEIQQEKKNTIVDYGDITNVNLVIPDPNMAYYILKIDVGHTNYVLPFIGKRDKCDVIYHMLLKKTGVYMEEEQDEG